MVQRLGLGTFSAMAWVQSLVPELRFYEPHGVTKKKKNVYIYKALISLIQRAPMNQHEKNNRTMKTPVAFKIPEKMGTP